MLDIFQKWYRRYLFEEESVLLLVLLTIAVVLLMTIGDILAPVVAALVLAFLMQGVAGQLERHGVPQWLGVSIAYVLFVGAFFGLTLGVFPLVWRQLASLAAEMPRMLEQGRQFLGVLPERYPELITGEQLNQVMGVAKTEIAQLGQALVSRSMGFIPGILSVLVYMILIPMLVFFFLKDREELLQWFGGFLPAERPLLRRIWGEMNEQFANYARGKVLEIIIVGTVSFAAFSWLGLRYAALLGLAVGLSVIIPYIGAALVTLPVVIVGFFQWGMTSEFYTLCAVYLTIQVLDGNVLVPLLFSEAVNLHPVAILMAVLFFGGIWGLWGVFFAIPLATLIKAVINAWPSPQIEAGKDVLQDPME
ncbi:MAG: AI-2E family transporter [Halieaceae bacterium]|nr:AI-2E family transporter [Halieaceae bacterium]MCP5203959.1 AI-2E family transporter [Pseudomonadales bacterium]